MSSNQSTLPPISALASGSSSTLVALPQINDTINTRSSGGSLSATEARTILDLQRTIRPNRYQTSIQDDVESGSLVTGESVDTSINSERPANRQLRLTQQQELELIKLLISHHLNDIRKTATTKKAKLEMIQNQFNSFILKKDEQKPMSFKSVQHRVQALEAEAADLANEMRSETSQGQNSDLENMVNQRKLDLLMELHMQTQIYKVLKLAKSDFIDEAFSTCQEMYKVYSNYEIRKYKAKLSEKVLEAIDSGEMSPHNLGKTLLFELNLSTAIKTPINKKVNKRQEMNEGAKKVKEALKSAKYLERKQRLKFQRAINREKDAMSKFREYEKKFKKHLPDDDRSESSDEE